MLFKYSNFKRVVLSSPFYLLAKWSSGRLAESPKAAETGRGQGEGSSAFFSAGAALPSAQASPGPLHWTLVRACICSPPACACHPPEASTTFCPSPCQLRWASPDVRTCLMLKGRIILFVAEQIGPRHQGVAEGRVGQEGAAVCHWVQHHPATAGEAVRRQTTPRSHHAGAHSRPPLVLIMRANTSRQTPRSQAPSSPPHVLSTMTSINPVRFVPHPHFIDEKIEAEGLRRSPV